MLVIRERELELTDKQVTHRINLEDKVITHDIANSSNGRVSALILTVLSLAVTALFVLKGYATQGLTFGSVVIVSLASIFVYGTQSRRNERRKNRAKVTGSNSSELTPDDPSASR